MAAASRGPLSRARSCGPLGLGLSGCNELQTLGLFVGSFVGRIKSFSNGNGYGFIDCPEVRSKGGFKDVFLHKAQLRHFTVGSSVRFGVYLNKQGQPQAWDLEAVRQDGIADLGPPTIGASGMRNAEAWMELGRFRGVVKSFSSQTGYGFVSSAELRAKGHERDAFLHHTQVQGFEVGRVVRFTAFLDGRRRLKAMDLQPGDEGERDSAGASPPAPARHVAQQHVVSIGGGYISLSPGEEVEELYSGSAGTGDEEWLFVARGAPPNDSGWLLRDKVARCATGEVTTEGRPTMSTLGNSEVSPRTSAEATESAVTACVGSGDPSDESVTIQAVQSTPPAANNVATGTQAWLGDVEEFCPSSVSQSSEPTDSPVVV